MLQVVVVGVPVLLAARLVSGLDLLAGLCWCVWGYASGGGSVISSPD